MAALSDIVLYRPLEDSFEIGIKTNLSSYQPSIFNESLENYIQKKTIKNASSNVKKPEIYKTGKANKYKTEYEALLEKKIQSILPSVFSLYKNCLSGSP
ncbi:MAG: hypothetical protein WCG42_03920, partial [Parachlamydiaceae bacterium]